MSANMQQRSTNSRMNTTPPYHISLLPIIILHLHPNSLPKRHPKTSFCVNTSHPQFHPNSDLCKHKVEETLCTHTHTHLHTHTHTEIKENMSKILTMALAHTLSSYTHINAHKDTDTTFTNVNLRSFFCLFVCLIVQVVFVEKMAATSVQRCVSIQTYVVPLNGVVFTLFTRGDHMNAPPSCGFHHILNRIH